MNNKLNFIFLLVLFYFIHFPLFYFILSFFFSFFILDLGRSSSMMLHVTVTVIISCNIKKIIETSRINNVIYKSTCPENYIPAVMPPLNLTSPPSTAATFLATHLMAVLQPSGYSVFHGGDTPIQLSLPWRSCSCQCLNTETSAQGNRGFTTETPSISYSVSLYIRLVVTL